MQFSSDVYTPGALARRHFQQQQREQSRNAELRWEPLNLNHVARTNNQSWASERFLTNRAKRFFAHFRDTGQFFDKYAAFLRQFCHFRMYSNGFVTKLAQNVFPSFFNRRRKGFGVYSFISLIFIFIRAQRRVFWAKNHWGGFSWASWQRKVIMRWKVRFLF